jgi:hypothetical protein
MPLDVVGLQKVNGAAPLPKLPRLPVLPPEWRPARSPVVTGDPTLPVPSAIKGGSAALRRAAADETLCGVPLK